MQAIRKHHPSNRIIQKLQKAIKNCWKILALCWLQSHVGIYGNESADKLAVIATTQALSTQFR